MVHAALIGPHVQVETVLTRARAHAAALAREAVGRGAQVVAAWGGDGTVNEVASALAFSDASLAIIPAGSGNGLARALGIPLDPAGALQVVRDGVDRRMDAGEINGRLFFNVAGVGLDAHVAHLFDARGHERRGPIPYFTLGARELIRWRPVRCSVRCGEPIAEGTFTMVAIANTPQYGSGVQIAPGARFDDGLLDAVFIEARFFAVDIYRAALLLAGRIDRAPGVTTRRLERLEIAGPQPLRFHFDGEVGEAATGTLGIQVRRDALRIRVPRGVGRKSDESS
jgi:YegS/Rv2252/BmrU family lipid kinase